jgi:methylated-DNA-[protein]-cysteine S-methyltransferase
MLPVSSELFVLTTPIGNFEISINNTKVLGILFTDLKPTKILSNKTKQIVANELKKYFINPKYKINIPLTINGTKFQRKVWEIILQIPSGKTKTYGEIAKRLKTSPQAIGQACKANKILLAIPCHRVVNKNKLGGYCGGNILDLVLRKEMLLKHEKTSFLWET